MSDSVSFCYFQGEQLIRLLQSGFNQERQWEIIEGEKQTWEDKLFSKLPLEIGTIGMVINFIVSLIVSRVTKPTPNKIKNLVESIRYPK